MNEVESVDVVLPVYNEEATLKRSVSVVRDRLSAFQGLHWRIVIAENGSTDGTLKVAAQLAQQWPEVVIKQVREKGRGRALRQTWLESTADYVCYMDIDLSTDLDAVEPLLEALRNGCDVVAGSRLLPASRVTRCLHREVLSRSYNAILKAILWVSFSDAQCGFKGARRGFVQEVIPRVRSDHWFFDTEMLYLADKNGYRLKEIPVRWVEDPDTRVRIASAVLEDLKGVFRLRFSRTRFRRGPAAARTDE
jgi:glycosyltransferase involved in cell wall biosynthesis